MSWASEISTLAKRLRSVLRDAEHANSMEGPEGLELYRALVLRAARLDHMLDAKADLGAPSLGAKDGQFRSLVERAARTARRISNRMPLEGLSNSFWSAKHAEQEVADDRDVQALTSVFDAEDHALLAGFSRRRQVPLPPESGQPSTYGVLQHLDPFERHRVREWLRNYRLNRLAFGTAHHRDKGVLEMLNGDIDEAAWQRVRQIAQDVGDTLGQDDLQDETRSKVVDLVREVAQRLEELGFDGLVDSIANGALSPSLTPWINLVPSTGAAACSQIVLAIIRGRTGKYGWVKTLAALRTHLIRCDRATKVVIIVTNQWDGASFADDYAPDFQPYTQRGVRWVTLLGGRASRGFSHIALDL